MTKVRHRGRWTLADRDASVYQYLPVDVPPGAAGLTVTLQFDRGPAVLDLGLIDPERFRGWSGGERDRIAVARDTATPGYLPGELPAGEWSVLLGLHRIPPGGIEYEVSAETGPIALEPLPAPPPRPERPPLRNLPAAQGRRWLAGDLHAHTVYSDGSLTIGELACLARSRGLDFLAVTDHNSPSHHPHLPAAADHAGIILLPGQEVTTDTGHANCLGDVGWIDFREPADSWLVAAEARGGLMSINHPLAGDCRWRRPIGRRPALAEVWHSSWDRLAPMPLAWWAGWGAGTPIGGSDFHRFDGRLPGRPTTWVEAEDELVLQALEAGRVAISAEPTGPILLRHHGELLAIEAEGTQLHGPEGTRATIRGDLVSFSAAEGPWWLTTADGRTVALSA